MEVKARQKYLRQSPRKVRLVADSVRGLSVDIAQHKLTIMNQKASQPILKVLNSGIANAKNNLQIEADNLYIKEISIDQGPTLGRWMPRAFGRATPIHKKTSHINITLAEKVETIKTDKKVKQKIKDAVVVKKLDDVKKDDSTQSKTDEKIDKEANLANTKEEKSVPQDLRIHGKGRNKQHLDNIRSKEKGGSVKKMFQRKSG